MRTQLRSTAGYSRRFVLATLPQHVMSPPRRREWDGQPASVGSPKGLLALVANCLFRSARKNGHKPVRRSRLAPTRTAALLRRSDAAR
jgi:hypothetical protein